jgi:hypothetical protein
MSESIPDDLDRDAIEAWAAATPPEDWEAADIVFSPDLEVRLEVLVERDLFALLTLAARQTGMPLLEWIKTTAREQALRTLDPAQSGVQRTSETGQRAR